MNIRCVYHVPPLLRGNIHLVRDTAPEKEFDIAIEMALDHGTNRATSTTWTRTLDPGPGLWNLDQENLK